MSNIFERLIALILFILSLPILAVIYVAIKLEDGGSFFFSQERVGKDGEKFTLLKIRTMIEGAEELRNKYINLNETGGPTFKIKDDPRFTKVGKVVSRIGIDELPQLINVVKGEMSMIGPRPLPTYEARKIPKRYQKRQNVLPGITSLWVVSGLHSLTFDEWMELDLKYVEEKRLLLDLKIAFQTVFLIVKFFVREALRAKQR